MAIPTAITRYRPSGCSSAIRVTRSFLVASPSAAGDRLVSAKDERRADDAQPGVEQTAGDEADSLEQALVLTGLECPSEHGLREAPDRVAAEPDSKRAKEEAAETGIRYLLERAGTILELAVLAERDLERQRRHEPERDPFGDEATSRQPPRPFAARRTPCLALDLAHSGAAPTEW